RSQNSATPLLGSQKAGVWTNFRICFHVGKTVKNLKHEFGVHRLVIVWPHAFPDDEPTAGSKRRARFVQAKQKILGDVHDVNSVHEIEFSRGNPLSAPWQIEIDRRPLCGKVRILSRQFSLITAPKIRVWLGNYVTLEARQKLSFAE